MDVKPTKLATLTLETVSNEVIESINPFTISSINNYVEYGCPPGSFIEAVLRNDLTDALRQADAKNLNSIVSIVTYVYCAVPPNCWGSRDKVRDHLARGQELIAGEQNDD